MLSARRILRLTLSAFFIFAVACTSQNTGTQTTNQVLPPAVSDKFHDFAESVSGSEQVSTQSECYELDIQPIGHIEANIAFPVDFRASIFRPLCQSMSITWSIVEGPPEMRIDGAGGLFYYTPESLGTHTVTIKVREFNSAGSTHEATETFTIHVSDSTITAPLFRDYIDAQDSYAIKGWVKDPAVTSWSLHYAELNSPDVLYPIAGPFTHKVNEESVLANWNISDLPDGGRYIIYLKTQLSDGNEGTLRNEVIIDRQAKAGWPKRLSPLPNSPIAVDLNDDAKDEIVVLSHFGELHIFTIEGEELYYKRLYGSTYGSVSAGDINGDGKKDLLFTTDGGTYSGANLRAHHHDGSEFAGFPKDLVGYSVRTSPLLIDIDGDGDDEIFQTASAPTGQVSKIFGFDYVNGQLVSLPGWPVDLVNRAPYTNASAADIDGDGDIEIIVADMDRISAWHHNGSPVSGLHNAPLVSPISHGNTIGAGGTRPSKVAIADIDFDGSLEIIVGSNVLRANGQPYPGWEAPKSGAITSLSPAVGDFDQNPANGLEIVLGRYAWHADGTPLAAWPISEFHAANSILVDCGQGYIDAVMGKRAILRDQGITAFNIYGQLETNYPRSLYGNPEDASTPFAGDFDADGKVDIGVVITDASYGGILAIYNMPGENFEENHQWAMEGHNIQKTGLLTPSRANRPVNLSYNGSQLTWTDRSQKESAYIVEHSATGEAFTFNRVARLPANTTSYSVTQAGIYRVKAERAMPYGLDAKLSKPSNVVAVEAEEPADTIPPSVSIASPSQGANLSGVVSFSASASDASGIASISFYVDGELLAIRTESPFAVSWNTEAASDGSHSLVVRATDGAGNVAQSSVVSVTVDNAPEPPPVDNPPSVSISSPSHGATVSGDVVISANASDDNGVASVKFYVNNVLKFTDTLAPYAYSWDSSSVSDGSATIRVVATDSAGQTDSQSINVNMDNVQDPPPPPADTESPVVNITSPADNSTFDAGSRITIQASASDNVSVSRVEFRVDGSLICNDSTASYSCSWRMPNAKGKSYRIQVRAIDSSGNSSTDSVQINSASGGGGGNGCNGNSKKCQ